MTKGIANPSLQTFLSKARWSVSRYMLEKIGSALHEIKFVTLPDEPFRIHQGDYIDPFNFKDQDYYYIHRTFDLGAIGLLCCSNTIPSLREIVISATISEESPILFGPQNILRTGFEEEDESGKGKTYTLRADFTSLLDYEVISSNLLVLSPGLVHYPLRHAGTDIYHKEFSEKYKHKLNEEKEQKVIISKKDREAIQSTYMSLKYNLVIDIGLILDSNELLAFHWNGKTGEFREDFYNCGLTNKP